MSRRSVASRWLLTATLMCAILFGALGQSLAGVEAATGEKNDEPEQKVYLVKEKPMPAPDSLNIVISEFRTRGPAGTDDEFVELFNPSGSNI
ncbi:MAG: hypothetical protein AB1750_03510, partial [Chloroflexota bacterium]